MESELQVMGLNIAICDDEEIIREQIKELAEKETPGVGAGLYETGDALLATGKQFDIVFLDIQMEGTDGIETAKMLRQRDEDTILIFITGIREYVFEAFDVAAFHYLLKPIEEDKFREVFHRAGRELEKRKSKRRETVFIKTRNRSFSLEKDGILYIESRGKKVEIHTTGETIEAYASMNEMEGQLGDGFFRSHRGYLVNMAYVAEYDSGSITLNNGEYVYLAKEKYGEFVKAYMRYLRNGVGADD
ncbi:LytTR family DNA-binding domain-containing protein [Lachnospiraceae bacterium 54-11]